MKTPPMFYPQEDGKLVEIPEEHAAILELYRDRMPVVFEVQESGPPMLYPLVDVDEEPYGSPQPGTLETAALRVARALKAQRFGEELVAVDYQALTHAVIPAYVADMAEFASACSYDETEDRRRRHAGQEARRVGRELSKRVDRAVRQVVADASKGVAV